MNHKAQGSKPEVKANCLVPTQRCGLFAATRIVNVRGETMDFALVVVLDPECHLSKQVSHGLHPDRVPQPKSGSTLQLVAVPLPDLNLAQEILCDGGALPKGETEWKEGMTFTQLLTSYGWRLVGEVEFHDDVTGGCYNDVAGVLVGYEGN